MPGNGYFGLSRLAWLRLWFYLGVPLGLGFLLGWWRVGRAATWPLGTSLAYWIGVALLSTLLQATATQLVAPLMRRARSPLWLTLLVGQLIGGAILLMPALNAWRLVLRTTLYPEMSLATRWVGFEDLVQRMPSNAVLWVGLNLLFFYGLRMPRFGYHPPGPAANRLPAAPDPPHTPAAASAPEPVPPAAVPDPVAALTCRDTAEPAFMARVRPDRRSELLAVEADGHYLHVHTRAGKDLILYRLCDALTELEGAEGARVHRSWWVAQRALSRERHREILKLVNGLEVPVSRSYRLAARERGWID